MNQDINLALERRSKWRFSLQRQLRYRVLDDGQIVATGEGRTTDISSKGVAFVTSGKLPPGGFIELSISWPALLDETCPMQLIVFGRVVRANPRLVACTVEKYEFRTQPRNWHDKSTSSRGDTMLQRWVESVRKDYLRTAVRAVAAHA